MAADTITEDVPPKKKPARKKRAPAKRTSAASKQKKDAALEPKAPSTDAELSAKAATLPREISGLLTLAIALGILLALVSFEAADLTPGASVRNLIGPVGASIADILLTIFGLGALCLDALMWYLGVMLLLGRRPHVQPTEIIGQILFVAASTLLAHLAMYGERFLDHSAGGVLGEFTGEVLRGLFGTVGAYILGCCVLTMSLLMVTNISLSALVRTLFSALHRGRAYIIHRVKIWLAYRSMLKEEQARLERIQRGHTVEEQARLQAELSVSPLGQERYDFEEDFDDQVEKKLSSKLHRLFGTKQDKTTPPPKPPKAKTRRQKNKGVLNAPTLDARVEDSERDDATSPPTVIPSDGVWSMGSSAPPEASEPSELGRVSVVSPDVDDSSGETLQVDDLDVVDVSTDEPTSGPSPRGRRATQAKEDDGPRIVLESEAKARARRIKDMLNGDDGRGVLFKPQKKGDFELPSLSFLNYEDNLEDSVDPEVLRQMARQIEKTLRDFKVEGQIKDICPGPVITVFEFSPAPGVKISKISNLSDDLAMALAALSVRIVAPIPGKGVVGIEVPNPTREIVYMKEILAEDTFMGNKKMSLPMGLGKDTAGNAVVTDLAKMPHLLVAGATGSGKSVAVNTMITSLLYKNSPDDVRLIMVDPKMLEFSIYADIPHLLLPVVTDPRQATVALNWAVQEMERRYQALADLSVRNIKGYNAKVDKLTTQAQADMAAGIEESSAIKALGIKANGEPEHTRIPYIVVIIDEFADLMMTASKDVETAVARLAQKARASGIHLILATQRPSTDVITGLIKANFPTRMALRVTSKTDSRVILDHNGAENLLGMGDMLFVPPGTSYMQRVHGAYVSETEIEQVVSFLKTQGDPQYDDSILVEEQEESSGVEEELDKDEHYEDAVRLVVESGQASISMIQRKLRVGYNRAARMVEVMEKEGLVSAPDGCKPREVLVDVSPY